MRNQHISVPEAVHTLAGGGMIILCDHPDRENEGDFVVAAELATVEHINTFVRDGRGLVCCPLEPERARQLELGPQAAENHALHGTQFTVSIDAAACSGSGISIHDRVITIRALADPGSNPDSFVRPGHIFPLTGHPEGVRGRAGHTEATIALLKLAQLRPVGVICEIISDSGAMATGSELVALAKKLNIAILSVDAIQEYLHEQNKQY